MKDRGKSLLATTNSACIWGMKGDPVKVEVNLARGLPSWHLVGLGDKAIKESIDRIRAAISNSGYDYPRQDVTINLVPAGTPKHGSHFDLPMAIALLAAMGIVKGASYQSFGMVGELSLSGQLQRVSGALLLVQSMKVAGIKNIIVPEGNSTEAAMVQDVGIYPASSLAQVVDYFNGQKPLRKQEVTASGDLGKAKDSIDYIGVRGQESGKRAMMICAAGGHGILLKGTPGCGKTMLNAGCDIDMRNHKLRNVSWPDGGITGTCNFVRIISMNSDGTVAKWSNSNKLQFKNGILISGTFS